MIPEWRLSQVSDYLIFSDRLAGIGAENIRQLFLRFLQVGDAQRKHIVDVLKKTGWVIEGNKGAASALGLAPSSLRSKMKRLDIVRPS